MKELLFVALAVLLWNRSFTVNANNIVPSDGKKYQICRNWTSDGDLSDELRASSCVETTNCLQLAHHELKNGHVGIFLHSREMFRRLLVPMAAMLYNGNRVSIFLASGSLEEVIDEKSLMNFLPCELHIAIAESVVVATVPAPPEYTIWQHCITRRCRQFQSADLHNVRLWNIMLSELQFPITLAIGSADILDWKVAAEMRGVPAIVIEDSQPPQTTPIWQRIIDYAVDSQVFVEFNFVRTAFGLHPVRTLSDITPELTLTLDKLPKSLKGDWAPPCFPCRPEHVTMVYQAFKRASKGRKSTCPLPVVFLRLSSDFSRLALRNLLHALTLARETLQNTFKAHPNTPCDDAFMRMLDFVVLVINNQDGEQPEQPQTPTFVESVPLSLHQAMAVLPYEYTYIISDCDKDETIWRQMGLLTGTLGRTFCVDTTADPRQIALDFLLLVSLDPIGHKSTGLQQFVELTERASQHTLSRMMEGTKIAYGDIWDELMNPDSLPPSSGWVGHRLWTPFAVLAWLVFLSGILFMRWFQDTHFRWRSKKSKEWIARLPELFKARTLLADECTGIWKSAQELLPVFLQSTPEAQAQDNRTPRRKPRKRH